jgi:LuxR family transcriptional regulator, maltose regulon positive regulatory protein
MPERGILQTKFLIPPVQVDAVARPRLIEKINQGTQKKLMLVYAPAGYGKSTLLAQWAAQSQLPVLWLNLDPEDNSQFRLQGLVLRAMAKSYPLDVIEQSLESLKTQPLSSQDSFETFNEILASIQSDFVFVLDDYQLIDDPAIHQVVQFWLEHVPPHVHLLISSRTIPPLHIQSLRAKRQVAEIHPDDLRFNRDEIQAFFNRVCELCLSDDEIVEIEKRTEGWAACLQLAALSIEGLDLEATHQYISAFTGSNRHVWDYLMEEVYARLSEETRTFLEKTSILRQLNASACDAVTQRSDSKEMLTHLERANLVVPVDDQRRWYRFPSLIADFLFRLLQEEVGLAGIQELHRRASEWYERAGILTYAVNHALASLDMPRSMVLLNKIQDNVDLAEMFDWKSKFLELPDEVLSAFPDMCLNCAWSAILGRDLVSYERPLRIAERAWEASGNQRKLGEVFQARALISRYRGDVVQAIQLAEHSLQMLPEDEKGVRARSMFTLAMSHFELGRVDIAEPMLAQARIFMHEAGDDYTEGMMTASLARIWWLRGELRRAETAFKQVVQWTDRKLYDQVLSGNIFLGAIYYEWNRLDLAEKHLLKGLEDESKIRLGRYSPYGFIKLASVYWEGGDRAEAAEALGKALSAATGLKSQADIRRVKAHQARLALRDGNLATAQLCMDDIPGLNQEVLLDYRCYYEWMTLTRLWISQGKVQRQPQKIQAAIEMLEVLLGEAKTHLRARDTIEILGLQAVAHWHLGDRQRALGEIDAALTQAQSERFVRVFLDENEPMAELLSWALTNDIQPRYASLLLSEYHLRFEEAPPTPAPQHSPGQLSPRELEILQAIARGMSTQAIAEQLFISSFTVRTHIKKIFEKLGAHSRMQAVELARLRRLI